MNSILLRLLGLPTEESASVTDSSIQFAPLVSATIIILIAMSLGFVSWLAYRSTPEDVPPGRRRIMVIMRATFFIMLLGLLLRPVIQLDLEREHKRTLAVLIDSSASMSIADPRKSVADRAREAITNGKLKPDAGIEAVADSAPVTPTTRSTIAAQALNSEKINLMENLADKAELVKYSFAGKLGDSKFAEDPQLPETSIGNAMHEVLRRHSADDLGGIFLVTDGAHNEGRAPSAVAESLRERGIKVFTYGVGTTDPRDISVGNIDLPSVALAEDAIPVTVKLNHRGMNGEKAKVIITLAGVKAGEKEITLNSEGEQEITIPIVPGKPNNYEIEARIETSGGEILDTNNKLSRGIRVLDSSLKVLMVESSPRWEFKYIQSMLLRERRIDLDCFLAGVDPAVARSEDTPYIENFPENRKDLFSYDLIIFGDIDPEDIPENAITNISSFVADSGGALIILAGKRFTPSSYRNTELERLLPVELAPTRLGGNNPSSQRPIQLKITETGLDEGFLNLESEPEQAEKRWSQLPPIFWSVKTIKAKPAAKSYLLHPDGEYPIVAMQRYGSGEVLWVGTENTWRWRKNTGDLYHTRFWGQIVQRMAGRKLATGSRKSELRTDRAIAKEGEKFTIFARLLDENFMPRDEESITASLESRGNSSGPSKKITLRKVPGEPGSYRTEFAAEDPGKYRLKIAEDSSSGIDLTVRGADREFSETAMNEKTLREISSITDGKFLREEDLYKLPEIANIDPTTIKITRESELWNSPLYFILLLLPITIEWFLRKFAELK